MTTHKLKIALTNFFIFAAVILIAPLVADAADASKTPYAQMVVQWNGKNPDVTYELTTFGRQGGDVKLKHTVKNGVDKLSRFETWYEERFAQAYLDSDYKNMWKKLRARGQTMAKEFLTDEIISALKGNTLLVVVDETHPFPIDTFRVGDKWLFEIVPIIHATTPGPKDVSDPTKYKSIVVVDCQGPKDREGMEAPNVYADLQKIPGVQSRMLDSLSREATTKNLTGETADIIHLATHAHPDEFFPGRKNAGIKTTELEKLKLNFHTFLSTGCNTGNPLFARGVLHGDTKFFIASMYVTAGKDGVAFGRVFYPALFSGSTPFEAFYKVKQRITGNKSDFPDILRFVFYVK